MKPEKKKKKKLDRSDYLIIVGLFTLGKEAEQMAERIEKKILKVLGQKPELGSHVGDAIFGSRELDEALDLMGFIVPKL